MFTRTNFPSNQGKSSVRVKKFLVILRAGHHLETIEGGVGEIPLEFRHLRHWAANSDVGEYVADSNMVIVRIE